MHGRCFCKSHVAYEIYGGRGIRVCERWRGPEGFKNFLDDMGPRPNGKTLDRINPQGHYSPLNCRWADKDIQTQNQRRFRWPEGGEEKMPRIESVREMEKRLELKRIVDFEAELVAELNPY
jgi:hypothetical protein